MTSSLAAYDEKATMQVSGSQDRSVLLEDVILRLASETCRNIARRRGDTAAQKLKRALDSSSGFRDSQFLNLVLSPHCIPPRVIT